MGILEIMQLNWALVLNKLNQPQKITLEPYEVFSKHWDVEPLQYTDEKWTKRYNINRKWANLYMSVENNRYCKACGFPVRLVSSQETKFYSDDTVASLDHIIPFSADKKPK